MRNAAFAIQIMLAVFISSCTFQPPRSQSTPWPQSTIAAPLPFVRDQMLATMLSSGASVLATSDNMIKLEIPMSQGQGTVTQLFLGCPSCQKPKSILNILMVQLLNGTLVSMQYWNEVQQGNGSWQRFENTSNADFNAAVEALSRVKAKIEQEYTGLQ